MRRINCERECETFAATCSGIWPDDLQRHLGECFICSEVRLVAGYLQHHTEIIQPVRPLPSAGSILWKASLASKRKAVQRAILPLKIVRGISVFAITVSILWFFLVSPTGANGNQLQFVTVLSRQLSHFWHLSNTAWRGVLISGSMTLLCILIGLWYAGDVRE